MTKSKGPSLQQTEDVISTMYHHADTGTMLDDFHSWLADKDDVNTEAAESFLVIARMLRKDAAKCEAISQALCNMVSTFPEAMSVELVASCTNEVLGRWEIEDKESYARLGEEDISLDELPELDSFDGVRQALMNWAEASIGRFGIRCPDRGTLLEFIDSEAFHYRRAT